MLRDDQSPAPQANDGQTDDSGEPKAPAQQPEEVEFASLTGSTQDRIRKLVMDKRNLMQRLENLERLSTQSSYVPPSPGSNFATPDEEAALKTLSQKGVALKDDVTKTIDERLNLLRWEQEQARLENKYTGSDGEPKYQREEVEDYISSHPQYRGYAAEDVFRFKMFPDEFMNLELSKRGSKTGRSTTLRPTSRASSMDQGLTPEYIAERTDINKYPDAPQWQEEHRQEIDKVLSQMTA